MARAHVYFLYSWLRYISWVPGCFCFLTFCALHDLSAISAKCLHFDPFWTSNKSMQEFPRTNKQQSHESMRKESWDSFLCPSDRLTAVHSAVSASMTRNPQTFAMRRKKLRSWNDGILRPCGIELWINFDSLPCMQKSPHVEPFSSSQSMKPSRT